MKKTIIILVLAFILTFLLGIKVFAADNIEPPLVDHEFIYVYDEYYTSSPSGYPIFGYSFQEQAVEWKLHPSGVLYYHIKDGMEQYAQIKKWRYYRDGEDGHTAGWEIVKSSYYPADGTAMINKTNIIGSDVDVYDYMGNKVFPPPRPVLEMVLEQTSQTIPTKVGGAMKILTLCGVGCLALLMALPLFGKVLRRFRVK